MSLAVVLSRLAGVEAPLVTVEVHLASLYKEVRGSPPPSGISGSIPGATTSAVRSTTCFRFREDPSFTMPCGCPIWSILLNPFFYDLRYLKSPYFIPIWEKDHPHYDLAGSRRMKRTNRRTQSKATNAPAESKSESHGEAVRDATNDW